MFKLRSFAVLLAMTLLCAAQSRADEIPIKSGDHLAFMGDSITAAGAGTGGYCRLVVAGLAANGIKVEPIFAGISGHKSDQMLARLDNDVLKKKPQWMTLSCGVNDVWHGAKGIPLDQYKKNITEIVDKCQAANVKVMILTSTMIMEDASNANNKKLADYNAFLHELAKEKKCVIADLNADMQAAVKAAPPHTGNYLTVDGVHMNPHGNKMMANGILKAFGLDEAQMHKAHEFWEEMPGGAELNVRLAITIHQQERLAKLAESQHKSVNDLITAEVNKSVENLLKSQESPAK